MSRAKPKFFIANRHTNRIGHRKLSRFEEDNPRMFEISHSAHETWEAAHAWLIDQRISDLVRAKKRLALIERQLGRAKLMKKPEVA